MKSAVLVATLAGFSTVGFAQQGHHPLPHGQPARHTAVTHLDPAKAVHHFYLHDDGGTVDVSVKDPKDEISLHAIRMHVSRVANRFNDGDFSLPRPVHVPAPSAPAHGSAHTMFVTRSAVEQHPDSHVADHTATGHLASSFTPGAAALGRFKSEIKFTYTQTDTGARVEIVTTNPDAAKAVHEFLKFQIGEHRTGDMDAIVRRTYQTREP